MLSEGPTPLKVTANPAGYSEVGTPGHPEDDLDEEAEGKGRVRCAVIATDNEAATTVMLEATATALSLCKESPSVHSHPPIISTSPSPPAASSSSSSSTSPRPGCGLATLPFSSCSPSVRPRGWPSKGPNPCQTQKPPRPRQAQFPQASPSTPLRFRRPNCHGAVQSMHSVHTLESLPGGGPSPKWEEVPKRAVSTVAQRLQSLLF
ncbi:hypothetical protein LX36DRAFT_470603 [Colletotrichum falcatum]|nr:hypothetical protein LX36DRAFT_470603 [Colletotrichum falcatum]